MGRCFLRLLSGCAKQAALTQPLLEGEGERIPRSSLMLLSPEGRGWVRGCCGMNLLQRAKHECGTEVDDEQNGERGDDDPRETDERNFGRFDDC